MKISRKKTLLLVCIRQLLGKETNGKDLSLEKNYLFYCSFFIKKEDLR